MKLLGPRNSSLHFILFTTESLFSYPNTDWSLCVQIFPEAKQYMLFGCLCIWYMWVHVCMCVCGEYVCMLVFHGNAGDQCSVSFFHYSWPIFRDNRSRSLWTWSSWIKLARSASSWNPPASTSITGDRDIKCHVWLSKWVSGIKIVFSCLLIKIFIHYPLSSKACFWFHSSVIFFMMFSREWREMTLFYVIRKICVTKHWNIF